MLVLAIFPLFAEAIVFRCEMLTGAISYQELPCDDAVNSQVILPISDMRTKNINIGQKKSNKQANKKAKIKNSSSYFQKLIKQANKKQLKARKARRKVSNINKEKLLRQQQRCNSVKIKIQLLQNRFRTGYTAKQEVRLNEQLIHYADLQKKYCS